MTATEQPDAARPTGHDDEDAARLAALGYTSHFRREMSLRANAAARLAPAGRVPARRLGDPGQRRRAGLRRRRGHQPRLAADAGRALVRQLDRDPRAVVLAVGLLYMTLARPWEKSTAAAGDAVGGGA